MAGGMEYGTECCKWPRPASTSNTNCSQTVATSLILIPSVGHPSQRVTARQPALATHGITAVEAADFLTMPGLLPIHCTSGVTRLATMPATTSSSFLAWLFHLSRPWASTEKSHSPKSMEPGLQTRPVLLSWIPLKSTTSAKPGEQ